MLQGCVPWPEEFARRYTEAGLWEGLTVAEMVERTARRHPQKVAVVHGETRTTYDDLVRSAKRLARGLAELGLQPQDRVVVQLPNGLEFVSLYLALNYIGVIPVMALRAHRHAEIRHFIRSSAAARLLHCRSRGLVRLPSHGRRHGRRVPRSPARGRHRRTGARSDPLPGAVGERRG